MRLLLPALALALLLPAAAPADVPVPELRARVTDLTGTLTAQQASALEGKLAAFQSAAGGQLAVLIVPTTAPETIEQFGIRVAEKWQVGRKGVDDGAILLVAKDDRRVRIEVGYGLEGALNDAIARRIVDETITPRFRQGQFFEGIDAATGQMMQVIRGEPLPAPARRAVRNGDWSGLFAFFLFGIIFAGPILRGIFGRTLGAGATGGLAALIAYLVTGLAIAAVIAAVVGIVAGLVQGFGGGRWSSGGRGWYGGGFGSGGFGGGGFTGGGGGFGGGGASGSW